jgi:hypothetical protein
MRLRSYKKQIKINYEIQFLINPILKDKTKNKSSKKQYKKITSINSG